MRVGHPCGRVAEGVDRDGGKDEIEWCVGAAHVYLEGTANRGRRGGEQADGAVDVTVNAGQIRGEVLKVAK